MGKFLVENILRLVRKVETDFNGRCLKLGHDITDFCDEELLFSEIFTLVRLEQLVL